MEFEERKKEILAIELKEALGDPMLVAMALRKITVKYPAVVVGGFF